MPGIAEDYVSPSVRWGLLKQDHPDAVGEFTHCTGEEIGIPAKFGGSEDYCVANILLRPTDDMPIIGYKPFSDAQIRKNDHASDAWNVLCTKALGRALKRAGYADTASEMRVLVQYKQRLAEHEAIKIDSGAEEGQPTTTSNSQFVEAETEAPVSTPPTTVDDDAVTWADEDHDWESEAVRDECHEDLVARIGELDPYYQEKAREVHQGINNREWPILSVQQFNFLVNAVEALHEQANEPEEEF